MTAVRHQRWLRVLAWLGVAAALLGTLMLYRDPDFLMRMADQIWSCF